MFGRGAALLLLSATAVAQVAQDQGPCSKDVTSDEAYKVNKRCIRKAKRDAHQKAEEEYAKAIKPFADERDANVTDAKAAYREAKKQAYYDYNFKLAVPESDRLKEINTARHQLNMDKKDAYQKACPGATLGDDDDDDCDNLAPDAKTALRSAIKDLKGKYHEAKKAANDKYADVKAKEAKTRDDVLQKALDTYNTAKLDSQQVYEQAIAPKKIDELKAKEDANSAYLDARAALHTAYSMCKPPQCRHGEDDDDEGEAQPAVGTPQIRAAIAGSESSSFTTILALGAVMAVGVLLFRGRAGDDDEEAQPFFNRGAGYTSV